MKCGKCGYVKNNKTALITVKSEGLVILTKCSRCGNIIEREKVKE